MKNQVCSFIKKETLAQVLCCEFEFCEILKNTFFTEHHWTTASVRLAFRRFLAHLQIIMIECGNHGN